MVGLIKNLLYFAVFFNVFIGITQTPEINSLTLELKELDGQVYFSKTNDLAELYLDHSASKTLELTEKSINSLEIAEFPEQLARANYLKARALIFQGEYDAAIKAFDISLSISDQHTFTELLAKIDIAKGTIYSRQGAYDKAREHFDKALKVLRDGAYNLSLAEAYLEYGKLEGKLENHDISLENYSKGLSLYQNEDDEKGISNIYYRMGVHYDDKHNEEKAIEYFTKSRAIKEAIQDIRGLSNSNLSLGVLNEEKGNFETAMSYYRQSLKGYQNIGDKSSLARVYNNIGVAYIDWAKYDSARVYLERSIDLHSSLKAPRETIRSLANLGEVYQLEHKYQQAIQKYNEAKFISESTDKQPMLGMVSNSLGATFLLANQLDSASYYLNRSLELRLKENNYFSLRHTYKNLSLLAEKRGNFAESLRLFKLHKQVTDSLYQTQRAKELAEIQARYDTEKQEKEIINLQQENEKRTLWRNIFAVGTLAALGIAFMLYQFYIYRNKKNKELLQAKETQHQELEKLDQLKSRFFNNISHEFRTPLTLILGPIDQLRKQVDDSLKPTIEVIERNGKRLLKLINQLLDLSKIESGKIAIKTTLIDVVPLCKGWIMSFNSIAETRSIKLRMNTKKEAHFLYIDQGKVEEIILNLLSNAFKYTGDGGKISVDLIEKKVADKEYLSISVSDTGTGIPAQELDHIFDRFYQASNADAEDVTGTGIGLALIKELAELHKGYILVNSEVGKGSTFDVLLPIGRDHLKDEEIITISKLKEEVNEIQEAVLLPNDKQPIAMEQDSSLPIVLLVEDNPDLRNYMRGILSTSYNVIEAAHGKEGVDMAIEHIPDIVLSDLMMPKMDGLQLCKLLKEDMRTSHIPIILLTAKSSKEDKIEGLKSLADDYLTKPFNTEELLVRLHNLIDLRKKMQSHFSSGDLLKPKKVQMNSMDQIFMERVTEQLETEISNALFGVVELAYSLGLSRSQLFRKIKAITSLTPNEFIRSFRLYRAMDMLKQQSATVSEIAYETGFQNPSYFSKCFQEQFGMAPSAVLKT